jgi:hypothetical protein
MPLTASLVAIAPERFGTVYQYGNSGGTFQRGDALYIVCTNPGQPQGGGWSGSASGTPPPVLAQARMLKSVDGGFTWNEVDVDNGPQVSLQKSTTVFRGLYSPITACYKDADTLVVGYWVWDYVYNDPVELRFSLFDMSTDTWGAETAGGPTSSTVTSIGMAQRVSDGATIFEYDGTETVMAVKYDRTFFVVYNAGWGAETPVDAAQTGSTANYSFASVVAGDGSRTHLFFANPDPNAIVPTVLKQNTLTSGNALIGSVQVTNQVAIGGGGAGAQFWGRATARLVAGVTEIAIGYANDPDRFLFVARATSADSPVFASNQITASAITQGLGVFNIGLTQSVGAGATYQPSTGTEVDATGSRDLVSWDPPVEVSPLPFAVPLGNQLAIESVQNGPGLDSSNGFFQAGFILNTFFSVPQ